MKVLITHPIHPGQFGAVAKAFVRDGHEVTFLCRFAPSVDPGYRIASYQAPPLPSAGIHLHLHMPEQAILQGQAVAQSALALAAGGYAPDLIIGHAGFGDLTFLPELFPAARLLAYAEFFYRAYGADVGFDPMLAVASDDYPRIRLRNALTLANLEAADALYAPTEWQKNTFPRAYHGKISVIHDGIDTALLRPARRKTLTLPDGRVFPEGRTLITYAARALEYYRGFHKFWPALTQVLSRNPEVEALVVGDVAPVYGPAQAGMSLRDQMIEEYPCDMSRVHFVPQLDRAAYINMLQRSQCHVYLTYPFVPSWSLVEALSCATPLIASDVAPVREVVGEGTCRLVDFFDVDGIAGAIEDVLREPHLARRSALQARERAVDVFDFETRTWPALKHLIQDIAGKPAA